MNNGQAPRTLLQAIRYFSDEQVAFDFVVSLRWPTGKPVCPRCGDLDNYFLATRHIWKCAGCRKQFSVRVGTIFEDSKIGFDKWMPAFWLICNSKNGISSYELARALGITQKSAWHMLHRIRLAMRTGSFEKMRGTVEVDETFVGGLAKNMHLWDRVHKIHGTGGADKTTVVGVLERGTESTASRVHAQVTANRSQATLHTLVKSTVTKGVTVYTDEFTGYGGLSALQFAHEVVNHAETYVMGRVHTNGIECFWNLLKRGLKGTYTHVDPIHLHRYLDERCFTFNDRERDDFGRLRQAVRGVAGRQLTYAELTGRQ